MKAPLQTSSVSALITALCLCLAAQPAYAQGSNRALSDLKESPLSPSLRSLLRSSKPAHRQAALNTIRELGPRALSTQDALWALLRASQEPKQRRLIAASLAAMGLRLEAKLKATLALKNDASLDALLVIQIMGPRAADLAPEVEALIFVQQTQLQSAAIRTLTSLESSAGDATLFVLASRVDHPQRPLIIQCLGRRRLWDACEPLIGLLKDSPAELKLHCLQSLKQIPLRHRADIDGVAKQLGNQDPKIRAAALTVLGSQGLRARHCSQAVLTTLERAQGPESLQALRCLTRIAPGAPAKVQQAIVTKLEAELEKGTHTIAVCECLAALDPRSTRGLNAALARLDLDDLKARERALRGLRAYAGRDERVLRELSAALKSPRAKLRQAALEAFTGFPKDHAGAYAQLWSFVLAKRSSKDLALAFKALAGRTSAEPQSQAQRQCLKTTLDGPEPVLKAALPVLGQAFPRPQRASLLLKALSRSDRSSRRLILCDALLALGVESLPPEALKTMALSLLSDWPSAHRRQKAALLARLGALQQPKHELREAVDQVMKTCLSDADELLREAAVRHNRRPHEALYQALKDPSRGVRAALLVALRRAPLWRPELLKNPGGLLTWLSDKDLACELALTLVLRGSKSTREKGLADLRAGLRRRRPESFASVRQLGALATPLRPTLLPLLTSDDLRVRRAAMNCLVAIGLRGASEAEAQQVARWSQSPEPSLRRQVLEVLETRSPLDPGLFLKALKDEQPEVRAQAARSLALARQSEALAAIIEALCQGLSDAHPEVGRAAARTLSRFGKEALPAVYKILKAEPKHRWAQQVLSDCPEACVPGIFAWAEEQAWPVRDQCARALARMAPSALEALKKGLSRKRPEGRRLARDALRWHGPGAIPVLVAEVQASKGASHKDASLALKHFGARAAKALRPGLKHADKHVRRRCLVALGLVQAGGRSTVAAVIAAFEDPEAKNRAAAAEALAGLHGDSSMSKEARLLLISGLAKALSDSHRRVRLAAIKALERCGDDARLAREAVSKGAKDWDPSVKERCQALLKSWGGP